MNSWRKIYKHVIYWSDTAQAIKSPSCKARLLRYNPLLQNEVTKTYTVDVYTQRASNSFKTNRRNDASEPTHKSVCFAFLFQFSHNRNAGAHTNMFIRAYKYVYLLLLTPLRKRRPLRKKKKKNR